MNPTLLNIITGVFVISCVCSMLFVLTRTYFCYFAKSKKCAEKCCNKAARDARLVEMYCGSDPSKAPEAKITYGEPMGYDDEVVDAKPKHNGESLGDFALKAVDKKKPGRKKKVKEL